MVKIEIDHLRKEYYSDSLDESTIDPDPFKQFSLWFDEVLKAGIEEPSAMFLATASNDGVPSGRIVLLKEFDDKGFVFYTNYDSRKGREINENPWVSIVFHWKELERQVRITGKTKKIEIIESDTYFKSRPYESQVSASISPQSEVIPNRIFLVHLREEFIEKNKGRDLKRPDSWGGYQIVPFSFEFWVGRKYRIHDRIQYRKTGNSWIIERLAP